MFRMNECVCEREREGKREKGRGKRCERKRVKVMGRLFTTEEGREKE